MGLFARDTTSTPRRFPWRGVACAALLALAACNLAWYAHVRHLRDEAELAATRARNDMVMAAARPHVELAQVTVDAADERPSTDRCIDGVLLRREDGMWTQLGKC